jgi:hypothetical protein
MYFETMNYLNGKRQSRMQAPSGIAAGLLITTNSSVPGSRLLHIASAQDCPVDNFPADLRPWAPV